MAVSEKHGNTSFVNRPVKVPEVRPAFTPTSLCTVAVYRQSEVKADPDSISMTVESPKSAFENDKRLANWSGI